MIAAPHIRTLSKTNKITSSRSPFFQPKLSVNPLNEIYEKEADTISGKVTNTSATKEPAFFSPLQTGMKTIQAKRELDAATEKDLYTKCLAKIGEVIGKLEENVKKAGMPDDIKEAVTLLRKKYTEKKIKCYYLDGKAGGETNFSTGEIYMDAKVLEGTDLFANIGEGNVLHEGTHALHNQKYPQQTKKYGKELDDKKEGKTSKLSDAEQKDMQRLDAYTEYWAYRKMQEYNNVKNSLGKNDDTIHADTIKDMRSRGAILPLNVVWAFDKDFDPRKWKPKN